jgi:hypothetical protein
MVNRMGQQKAFFDTLTSKRFPNQAHALKSVQTPFTARFEGYKGPNFGVQINPESSVKNLGYKFNKFNNLATQGYPCVTYEAFGDYIENISAGTSLFMIGKFLENFSELEEGKCPHYMGEGISREIKDLDDIASLPLDIRAALVMPNRNFDSIGSVRCAPAVKNIELRLQEGSTKNGVLRSSVRSVDFEMKELLNVAFDAVDYLDLDIATVHFNYSDEGFEIADITTEFAVRDYITILHYAEILNKKKRK